ncbi:hypothetical protein EJ04DRAFT_554948, partial [Polyplosphaeria fusca]
MSYSGSSPGYDSAPSHPARTPGHEQIPRYCPDIIGPATQEHSHLGFKLPTPVTALERKLPTRSVSLHETDHIEMGPIPFLANRGAALLDFAPISRISEAKVSLFPHVSSQYSTSKPLQTKGCSMNFTEVDGFTFPEGTERPISDTQEITGRQYPNTLDLKLAKEHSAIKEETVSTSSPEHSTESTSRLVECTVKGMTHLDIADHEQSSQTLEPDHDVTAQAPNLSDTVHDSIKNSEMKAQSEYLVLKSEDIMTDCIEDFLQDVQSAIKSGHHKPSTRGCHKPSNSSNSDSSSLRSANPSLNPTPESTPRKRQRGAGEDPNGDENESEDDDERRSNKKGKATTDRKSPLGLRCPFYSHDPNRYARVQACSNGRGFPSMARLRYLLDRTSVQTRLIHTRTHLKRDHTQPLRCPRCWLEMKSNEDCTLHLRNAAGCEILPPPEDDRLSQEQWDKMICSRSVARSCGTAKAQWKALYRALFPNDAKVPPPCDKSVMLSQLDDILGDALEQELRKEFSYALGDILERIKPRIPLIVQNCRTQLQQSRPQTGLPTPSASSASDKAVSPEKAEDLDLAGARPPTPIHDVVSRDYFHSIPEPAIPGPSSSMHTTTSDPAHPSYPPTKPPTLHPRPASHPEPWLQLTSPLYRSFPSPPAQPDPSYPSTAPAEPSHAQSTFINDFWAAFIDFESDSIIDATAFEEGSVSVDSHGPCMSVPVAAWSQS